MIARNDRRKTDSRSAPRIARWLERLIPAGVARHVHTPMGPLIAIMAVLLPANALILGIADWYLRHAIPGATAAFSAVMASLFLGLSLVGGILAWIVVLAHQSRRLAMEESEHHVQKLLEEVAAHNATAKQLQTAKEIAESASAAKSRYLLSVSHEIRSPLNSIYGYAQLMERGHDVTPDQAAKVIRRSAEHLTNLVEGLLDISQVESGVLRISSDTVRISVLLDQIANMFQPQAQAKGLQFLYERPDRLPEFVRTDQKRLRQILINLLSNAIKFTQGGTVTFRVQYRSQLATFDVIDTGIGILAEDMVRIFDPFERGSEPSALRQKGVGLGLPITQALTRILGGDLALESTPGKGSHFTVRLMLSEVTTAVADSGPAESVSGYRGKRRTVLLIDDDANQVTVLRRLLEPLGFVVHGALNGQDGLALAEQHKPDLALLDISMPGESGWDICRKLRATHGRALRIVMVSANAHEFNRGGLGYADHDNFLMKPVDLGALLDVVADQLDLSWVGQAGEGQVPSAPAGTLPDVPAEAIPFLGEIEQKALIGHVRGVETKIREMQEAVPDADPLAARLLACLDQFDIKGLLTIIRSIQ